MRTRQRPNALLAQVVDESKVSDHAKLQFVSAVRQAALGVTTTDRQILPSLRSAVYAIHVGEQAARHLPEAMEMGPEAWVRQSVAEIGRTARGPLDNGWEIKDASLMTQVALVAEGLGCRSPSLGLRIAELAGLDEDAVRQAGGKEAFVQTIIDKTERLVSGIDVSRLWPERLVSLVRQGHPLRVEIENPDVHDLPKIKSLLELLPQTELTVVLDEEYPGFHTERHEDIAREIVDRFKERDLFPTAEPNRDIRVIFAGIRKGPKREEESRDRQFEDFAKAAVASLLRRHGPQTRQSDMARIEGHGVWYFPPASIDPDSLLPVPGLTDYVGIPVLTEDGELSQEAIKAAVYAPGLNGDLPTLRFSTSDDKEFRSRVQDLARAMNEGPPAEGKSEGDLPIERQLFYETFRPPGSRAPRHFRVVTEILDEFVSYLGDREELGPLRQPRMSHFGFALDAKAAREYAWRNYGLRVLPADREILELEAGTLLQAHEAGLLPLRSLGGLHDIGGPLSRLGMLLWIPFVADNALLMATDTTPLLGRLQRWFAAGENPDDPEFGDLADLCRRYESILSEISPIWNGSYDRMRHLFSRRVNGGAGRIDLLETWIRPPQTASAISGYVSDSIAKQVEFFVLGLHRSLLSTERGGTGRHYFVAGSQQYHAGSGKYPSGNVVQQMLNEILTRMVGRDNFKIHFIGHGNETFRAGYEGLLVVEITVPQNGVRPLDHVLQLDKRIKALPSHPPSRILSTQGDFRKGRPVGPKTRPNPSRMPLI